MSWLDSAAQIVRRTDRSTKSRKARRSRNDRRAIFFEALESRHLLSVTFDDLDRTNTALDNDTLTTAQNVVSPGLTDGVVDMLTSPSGSVASGDGDFYRFKAAVTGDLNVSVAYVSGTGGSVQLYDDANATIGRPVSLDAGNPLASPSRRPRPTRPTSSSWESRATRSTSCGSGTRTEKTTRWRQQQHAGHRDQPGALRPIPAASLAELHDHAARPRLLQLHVERHRARSKSASSCRRAPGLATQPTNLGIRIRDTAGVIIASSNGTETNVDVATFNATNGTTYFVEVYSGSVGQVNQYDLQIQALTGQIHGYKFIDANGNGFFDQGENASGVSGLDDLSGQRQQRHAYGAGTRTTTTGRRRQL